MSLNKSKRPFSSSRIKNKSTIQSKVSSKDSSLTKRKNTMTQTDKPEVDELTQMKRLFLHYSNNETSITIKPFIKFLSDSQLIDNQILTEKYANVLFYSYSKAADKLPFPLFCDLFLKIVELKFSDDYLQNQKEAFKKCFEMHLAPLYKILANPPKEVDIFDPNNKVLNYQLLISKLTTNSNREVVDENFFLFVRLYQKYFCFENLTISKSQKSHLSNRAFEKIFKDFELSPFYTSLNTVNEIFNKIIDNYDYVLDTVKKILNTEINQNEGMYFTLYHFICGIYLVSVINIIKTTQAIEGINQYDLFIQGKDAEAFKKILMLILRNKIAKIIFTQEDLEEFGTPEEEEEIPQDYSENGSRQNSLLKQYNNTRNIIGGTASFGNGTSIQGTSIPTDKNKMPEINEEQKETSKINTASNRSFNANTNTSKITQINSSIKNFNEEYFPENQHTNFLQRSIPTKTIRDSIINDYDRMYYLPQMAPIVLTKYYDLLISVYKFYSELYYETNFSVYMTQNGFIKFLRDMGIVDINKDTMNTINQLKKKSNERMDSRSISELYMYSKFKANLLSFNNINSFFAKFSSVGQSNKMNSSSNKKINFENFLNIILCLSNKVFNPQFNSISFDDKWFSLENLTYNEFPIKYSYYFIDNYISPLYSDIKNFIEEDTFNCQNLQTVFMSEPINKFIEKIISPLKKMLMVYSDNQPFISYNDYFKMLCDYEIFPDLLSRTKMIKLFINFINDFDKEYIIRGENKVSVEIESCAMILLFIGIGGGRKDGGCTRNQEEMIIRLLNFIQRMIQSKGFEKITIKCGNNKIANEMIKVYNTFKG
ncbi:MAG: hypothetical protein MJ252_23450, partial [archaeon]|nr:hypothetical protein [archaeon]